MTYAIPMFPPRAGRAHALKSHRPRSVRPRLKQPSAPAPEPVLPPEPDHLPEHTRWGFRFYDAPAAAAHDGHPIATLIRLRQEAADEVERLLAFLDATEGDSDLWDDAEPTDAQIRRSSVRDLIQLDDDEDGGDSEPSLGSHEFSPAGAVSYVPSVSYGGLDLEGEHDGQEPEFCGLTADRAAHAASLGVL